MVAFGISHYIKLQKSSDVKNLDPSDNYLSLSDIAFPLGFLFERGKKSQSNNWKQGVSSHLKEVFCFSSLLPQFM